MKLIEQYKYSGVVLLKRLKDTEIKIPYFRNLVNGNAIDFMVQQKILNFGLVDAFKLMNPKNNNYNRIDFIYLSKNLKNKVKSTSFIHDAFTDYYSDHRPLCMEIER